MAVLGQFWHPPLNYLDAPPFRVTYGGFLKAKLTFGRTLTNLKSHETSPKSTPATFFVKKCQKRPRKAVFWEYLAKG